ncbi:DUF4214 domain-containing protein [Iamia majanohamensis]|uniref:DUF4214 domain-containing protein n=1 Tax=Iamia majanohamensis TaxID=467976 RepID=A0AAF0BVK2_9ACTN|nr:DUF4214 domain-containing protein [Iamia majanohamensis]WCO67133.1 DUF4214 domain-containing protein [Iamia majanohamensis]
MARRLATLTAATVLVLTVVAAGPAGADAPTAAPRPARQAEPRAACTENPFTAGFAAEVARRWPGKRFTAALFDSVTGCEYLFRPDVRITTASVLKAEILAGVVLRAQQQGRGLTAWEHSQVVPMIRYSDDPTASALWRSLGGVSGMRGVDRALGLTATTQASPWGLTLTTARDRNTVLRRLIWGLGGTYTAASRMRARAYLLDVTPSQRWGITNGVPSSWRVPMKNGFFTSQCCRWRTNTSGVVERPGRGAYALTVLSDGWATEAQGIAAVDTISGVVADWAAATAGPHPSAARAVHRSVGDVLGRAPSYDEERWWSARIGTWGTGGPDVLAELLSTNELDVHVGRMLRLYLGGLGTMPSAQAYAYRAWQLRTGRITATQLGDDIAASLGFTGGASLTDEQFVDRAVERTLGRTPSDASRQRWVDRLQGGMSRGAVLLHFADSAEARWVRYAPVKVGEVWGSMLRRPPAQADIDAWVPRLQSGTSLTSLAAMVFRSREYAGRW